MLPEKVKAPLQQHLEGLRKIHALDLADGYGHLPLPYALSRKYRMLQPTGAGSLFSPK
jgi:hypothetical protein